MQTLQPLEFLNATMASHRLVRRPPTLLQLAFISPGNLCTTPNFFNAVERIYPEASHSIAEVTSMRKLIQAWFALCSLFLGFQLLSTTQGLSADTFSWRTNAALVSADIQDGKLSWLLEQITSATGWRVYVEPDVSHVVSAKFENLNPGEALRLLLGDLNFALIPETKANAKLFVFRTAMGNATQRVVAINPAPLSPSPGALPGGARRRDNPERPGRSGRPSPPAK